MRPYPKPKRGTSSSTLRKRREHLREYRSTQAALAIERDGDMCVFCYFLDGKETPRQDVHHVFGRGHKEGDAQESYRCLLSTCREHHPPPILTYRSSTQVADGEVHSSILGYVIDVLRKANNTPINGRFKHVIESES